MGDKQDRTITKKTSNSMVRVALWVALILFIATGSCGWWFFSYVITPAPKQEKKSVIVIVPKGSSVSEIGQILAEQQLIKYDIRFLLLTRLQKSSSKLKAGEFILKTGQTPDKIIKKLVNPDVLQHAVTVPEGLRYVDIVDVFVEHGWGNREEFLRLVDDRDFIEHVGLQDVSSLEGFLFPDTYNLTIEINDARTIVAMMVRQFLKVWSDLTGHQYNGNEDQKILTLASMVERETGNGEERARIAGVFYNRLEKKMRLQSDPTVVYGLEEFSGKITRKDLRNPHPYNTYVIKGLPPGPICNPGKDAMAAVLAPEKHTFLYFVSKNDGSHYFSKSLKEHNRAVRKYLRSKGNK